MTRAVRLLLSAAAGLGFGVICGELAYHSPAARGAIGRTAGRGNLLAVASGAGIYETDLWTQDRTLGEIIVDANLREQARNEALTSIRTEVELSLLRSQFGSESLFKRALSRSGLSFASLREDVRSEMRSLNWLEKQLNGGGATATTEMMREFFESHRDSFVLPPRLRASHLFLAAHADTPSEVMEAKRKSVAERGVQISRGKNFEQLISELSEDEATKKRGGDLDFFSSWRMPGDFVDQVVKMKLDELSKPIQTHLGFHLVRVTEVRPPRQLSFEEVRDEIVRSLENTRRRAYVAQLAEKLGHAEYLRVSP
ncbi:MAG: peptidylprolyl isomerase [Chthoniobacterales bacterium]